MVAFASLRILAILLDLEGRRESNTLLLHQSLVLLEPECSWSITSKYRCILLFHLNLCLLLVVSESSCISGFLAVFPAITVVPILIVSIL